MTLHETSLSAPFFQQHLLTLCLCVTLWLILAIFQTFPTIIFCYLWSIIFDVAIIIVWGHQKPCSCKTVNLVLCILVAPLTILISLFLLRSPHSLRHNNIETRPVNKPTMASKCSSERKSQSINSASFTVILRTATTTPAFSSQPPWSNWGKTVNTEARHSTSRKAATCWMIMVITY